MSLEHIKEDKFYFKKVLLDALRSEKLPHSKPTFLKNEAEGIIPMADILVVNPWKGKEPYRVYNGKTIKKIVEILRERNR